MVPKLVLASESAYRRLLLDRLALPYSARTHHCDERALPAYPSLEERAIALATAKAQSLASAYPGSHILGSDQIAELDGDVLHKPGTEARAHQQLTTMSGKSHRLLTAIALISPSGETTVAIDVHRMQMRTLGEGEIRRYVAADQPLDCCGSYKIESLGVSLFERIEGDDFTAITGMPMIALCRLLRDAGFSLP
ncbi:MAG: septum formation protein Maf [Myxococcales bacterium]|nr:septum formation protein Maf [Myxococcales bacterium]